MPIPELPRDGFVERALAVALQIERDVVEAEGFEDFDEAGGHFGLQGLREFFDSDFDANQIAMEARAELAEAEGFERLFAVFHRFDAFLGDFGAVGDAGAEAGGGGAVPGGEAGTAAEFANLGFGEAGFNEGGFDVVGFGGALAGTPVAEIVDVDAIDNIRDAAFLAHLIQAGEEFVFAVEAAVFIVFDVFGVIEFEGFDVFVADVEVAGELFGVAFVGFGDGGGIGGDGNGVLADGLDGCPGEVG